MESHAASAGVPAPEDAGSLFVRQSSGLVRAFRPFDAFCYAIYADSIIAAAALSYQVGWPFNRANIPLGIVITCLAFMPTFAVYSMLMHLMPRAGGDYVWQSRSLGGFWGYILIFGPLMIGPWFFMAGNVLPGATLATAPLFVSLGGVLGAEWPVHFANWLVTKDGQFAFYCFYICFAFVVVALGMRFYARFQRWSFYIGCAGIVTYMIILLTTSHGEFVSSFNHFMANTFHYGNGNAYQHIIDQATKNGYHPVGAGDWSWKHTILIGPVLAYTFLFVAWSGNLAGEISGMGQYKRSLRTILGANTFAMVVCAIFMLAVISTVSNQFFTSSNFVGSALGNGDVPVTPVYSIFIMSMVSSPWLWLWIMITFSAWFWIWPTNNFVGSTRFQFAMAYDRMLPSKLTTVVGRTGTPIYALALSWVGSLIFGILFWYTSFSKLTLDLPLFAAIAFGGSTLAGGLMPFRASTKRIYQGSVLSKYHVGPLPLITFLSALGLLYFVFMIYLYATDSRYGVNSKTGLWFVIGLFALAIVFYYGFKGLRRRQGMDVSRTYREIPSD